MSRSVVIEVREGATPEGKRVYVVDRLTNTTNYPIGAVLTEGEATAVVRDAGKTLRVTGRVKEPVL